MTSGQDVSEYEDSLHSLGLVKSYFSSFFEEKKLKKSREKPRKSDFTSLFCRLQ
jgi:hypothetical protein